MAAKDSFLNKAIIAALVLVLWAVISVPAKLWDEEEKLKKDSRNNLNAIYEAEKFYYSNTQRYVGTDSLEQLISFIKSDSSLQTKQKIGELTHLLHEAIEHILDIPILKATLPLSQSLREITQDLKFNNRYFKKYQNLLQYEHHISLNIANFDNGSHFPNFSLVKNYVDSLNNLKNQLSEIELQTSVLLAKKYALSLKQHLSKVELKAVKELWKKTREELHGFIKTAKKTDLVKKSAFADRLKKFTDKATSAIKQFDQINSSEEAKQFQFQQVALNKISRIFLAPENFSLTKEIGILQLSETDSILVKLTKSNLICPDSYDSKKQRYIVSFKPYNSNLVVESPNLLNRFQQKLLQAVKPIQNLPLYAHLEQLQTNLNNTLKVIDSTKIKYEFKKSSDLIFSIKEIQLEFEQLDKISFYRYAFQLKNFIDIIQTEKKLSTLKPMLEDLLNPIDSLANKFQTKEIKDLEKRLQYFGERIQALDSLVLESEKLPVEIRSEIKPFYFTYENVHHDLKAVKSSLDPKLSDIFREIGDNIEEILLDILDGYDENIYLVFFKKHENHGYIENGNKSWESE